MDMNTIDWNEVWKNQMLKYIGSNPANDYASLWSKRLNAKLFWEITMENDKGRIEKTMNSLPITSKSRVLDIGSGPGVLSVLVSEKASHVTAVEPSREMMSILQDNIKKFDITNINCINKRWEDVDIETDLEGPYDIVFASYSLGMVDIKSAIIKMIFSSSSNVYLYWIAGNNLWDIYSPDIWPALHDKDYQSMPKSNILYNVLYQMGIYPNVNVSKLNYRNIFSSFDEAVEYCIPMYKITNSYQEQILRDYLKRVLKNENGFFTIEAETNHVEMWWQK